MKQLIIAGSGALATTPATLAAMSSSSKIGAGLIALYDSSGAIIDTDVKAKAVNKNSYISLFVGATEDTEMMDSIGMLELKDLSYVKSEYVAGKTFTAAITIPTPVVGNDYTITLVKKGTVFNERNKWSATIRATTGMTAANIATALAAQLKANGSTIGITATSAAAKVTVTSIVIGEDWKLIASDNLYGTAVTDVTKGELAVNDAVAIKDLYRQCIGDRGIYGTDSSGMILYKEPTITGTFTLYTLTFYNPRHNEAIARENVRQIVHLAVPTGAASIATLDKILKILTTVEAGVGG